MTRIAIAVAGILGLVSLGAVHASSDVKTGVARSVIHAERQEAGQTEPRKSASMLGTRWSLDSSASGRAPSVQPVLPPSYDGTMPSVLAPLGAAPQRR